MTALDQSARRVRVLIAEDSAVVRELLSAIVSQDPGLEVVGVARTGREAVELTERLRPDIVLMDVHMPEMGGEEATRVILRSVPTPVVMISASLAAHEIELSFRALEAGALSLLNKPVGPTDPGFEAAAATICSTLRLMSEVTVVRRWSPAAPRHRRQWLAAEDSLGDVEVIAIAASTGGPRALAEVLSETADALGPAILVVQHLADGFVQGFASWLAGKTGRDVQVGKSGELVQPGRVYLAPDGAHMIVGRDRRVWLEPRRPTDVLCPAADPLLCSVAAVFGRRSIGVVLTGMGADGAEGLLEIRRAGGLTVVQDEASCVVFGMPRRAIEIGAARHVLAPAEIGRFLARAASEAGAKP